MNNEQQVVLKIKPSGKVDIDAQNFNGVGCTEATEQIEIALGTKDPKRDLKPEYHNPAVSAAQQIKQDF